MRLRNNSSVLFLLYLSFFKLKYIDSIRKLYAFNHIVNKLISGIADVRGKRFFSTSTSLPEKPSTCSIYSWVGWRLWLLILPSNIM